MIIDTHAHLDFDQFDEDRDAVIQRAIQSDIGAIITIGTSLKTSDQAVKLSENYAPVFAAVGIHPSDCGEANSSDYDAIEKLSHHEKVIAIGEIGLDYYRMYHPKEIQMQAFKQQIQLARKLKLPVIVHNRDSHEDLIKTLLDEKADDVGGVLHSFSGTFDFLERVLKTNFFISFTGNVTFKNAEDSRALLAETPIERLLLETDCPFITPAPHRGKRNEPAFVIYTAEKIAEIKKIPLKTLQDITSDNARQLFNLPV